jgi:hypothetical protein
MPDLGRVTAKNKSWRSRLIRVCPQVEYFFLQIGSYGRINILKSKIIATIETAHAPMAIKRSINSLMP